ncbi:hypothetical protein Tco_0185024 [Tanacetum coccineum]
MYSYNYSSLDKLRWLVKTLKKGSPFRSDSETNEPPLRTYQLWKKTFYEETHKLDDITELPKSQPKKTYEEDLESEIVMVKMPSCMSFLGYTNAYDKPICNLDNMGDEVENPSPQSTLQVFPSFEVYTPPVTYPREVDKTLGTPMEEEPLDQTKLEDVGLTNHNISFSSREVPSFDKPKPQLNSLPNYPSLDISLGDQKGLEPPIKPHSLDIFRVKVINPLTIHSPPSPYVASFLPNDVYFYHQPCIDNPKKHYGFKPGLLGQSGSLGFKFLNLDMIEDD